ncbi:MAG: hypothetical protein IH608_01250 [Proteobacteria bacterium]|nr:hypothetical protein [Pseudomonadota bacterium]
MFDTPPQTVERYQVQKTGSPNAIWRFNHKCRTLMRGKTLRLEVLAPATVRWTDDGWRTAHDTPTVDTGLGVHLADLATGEIPAGGTAEFTFCWTAAGSWEGRNFSITVS